MKVNREELLDVFISDIPGAVIVSKDTYNDDIFVVPSSIGIKTYIGCVEFGLGNDNKSFDDVLCDTEFPQQVMKLSKAQCLSLFLDVPISGTAWLVTLKEYGYLWERIDHLLRFQNEKEYEEIDDDEEKYVAELYEARFNLRVGEII